MIMLRHGFAHDDWKTFVRFVFVGSCATLLQYLLLAVFVWRLHYAPVVASSIAYAISMVFNFAGSHTFTFRSSRAHASALARFAVVVAVGFGLNAALMWLSSDWLQLHFLIAQVLATIATLLWNYVAGLRWAFAS